jgi:hypothetical protein
MTNFKPWSALCAFALLTQLVAPVAADGVGVLGGGKWLYKPACAHACRQVIAKNTILCDAKDGSNEEHSMHTKRHSHATNTVECFLKDAAFIRTLALCIDQRCTKDDKVPISVIEEYWEGHVGTGSVGDWSPSMQPAMLYQDALKAAQHDIEGGNTTTTKPGASSSLTVTSLIADEDYLPRFHGNIWFDEIEKNHGRNS